MRRSLCLGALFAAALVAWAPALAQDREAVSAATIAAEHQAFKLPGDGPWGYVTYDRKTGRVFIGRYDGVQVVRADTGKLEATIGARTGDHGAVVAADVRRVFTSDAVGRQLGVYDQKTLSLERRVALGGEPDGLSYDPASRRVLALLPAAGAIVAVDAMTGKVAGRTDAGGEPKAGVADGRGTVFVTVRDRSEVLRLDAATLRVTARWPAGCERPSPIALDAADSRLFVACWDHRMAVLDSRTGRQIDFVATGAGTDAIDYDTQRRLIVAANGGGSITLIHVDDADHYTRLGDIPMPRGARTMALDPAGGRLFAVTADFARVQPPTKSRPFPVLIPRTGTFRMIVVRLPPH